MVEVPHLDARESWRIVPSHGAGGYVGKLPSPSTRTRPVGFVQEIFRVVSGEIIVIVVGISLEFMGFFRKILREIQGNSSDFI